MEDTNSTDHDADLGLDRGERLLGMGGATPAAASRSSQMMARMTPTRSSKDRSVTHRPG